MSRDYTTKQNPYNILMTNMVKLLYAFLALLTLEKLGMFKILKLFVILVLGVLMNSLIFKVIPSKQQRSLHEQDVHLVSDTSDSHIILTKQGVKYDDPKAWQIVHDLTESFQYYLIKSTVNLSKEKGSL